jgi:hypothetical protein
MGAIRYPEKSRVIPETFENFLLMDILHLNKDDIYKMGFEEHLAAVNYCWVTYTFRRVDYNLNKVVEGIMKGINKSGIGKGKGSTVSVDWSDINPVAKALAERSVIPERGDQIG